MIGNAGYPRVWDIDLRKRLQHAGRRFELEVRFASDARRLVLFGPSGAGKTQTLRMIAGLGTPDAGHVRVAGRTLLDRAAGVDVPARKRGMAYLFQDYALFPHLTVVQNIAFGVQRGWLNAGREPRHEAVDRWLRSFELTAVARQYPEQLSGGQRQRTALARALVAQPQALLLDEPLAALDPALRARLRDELADLQVELDIPLLIITHDEADVHRFGDEAFEMAAGRISGHGCAGAGMRVGAEGQPGWRNDRAARTDVAA
ncbi:MAG TPA: ATP-binding cassette domain-containing protein [Burkholderiaceae bacterium]|nr:ATP-binding cassette domain-containing protein [Burkholderiaceae bacterium]